MICKTAVQTICLENFQKKAPVLGYIFDTHAGWRTATSFEKESDRCFPVNFAKSFKTAIQHLCATAFGISVIVIKTLRIALLYHVYSARMAVELKLGCPKNKGRGKKTWIKRIRSKKAFIRNIFLFFYDTMDTAGLFIALQIFKLMSL